jgi:predicted ATPase/DNA-binding SARP family transcriptional activator
MSLLRMAVLGTPEVFHDGTRLTFALRKAQALLLYLAVEGGLHPRSKLAALLWPDSEPADARKGLRNALALLRDLLADAGTLSAQNGHLLSEHDLLGLDPQVPLELDLDVVQQAYAQVQRLSTIPSEPQRSVLVAQGEHALTLVRGPFLDGFWLREETAFDEWVQLQQHRLQVLLQLLCDRLSGWQEAGGEWEQAKATLTRWLALDPLAEEAYRRLMRVHLALANPAAALQVYATCRTRLAEALQIVPSADTVALAERIRSTQAAYSASLPTRSSTTAAASEFVSPLIGRTTAFSRLVKSFQQTRQGQPQAMLVVGEAGIGKTRLASEFVAWARAQGAEVLRGNTLEMGGRLPYQPLVEALRVRLEAENAPEDLLDDLWLTELSRLLPELRVRYPDLPAPTGDELTAKIRLFEAVARLVDNLARRALLVLFVDDLHWMDEASLDLVRYLGHYWKEHGSQVLLLGTVRSDQLEPRSQLATALSTLGQDLPVSQVLLQALSQAQTLQLVQAIAGEHDTRSGGELHERGPARPSEAMVSPSQEAERSLVALGDFLFAQTGGQPLYLLETLKLLRERELLVPRRGADGTWRLEPTEDIAAALAQEQSQRELLPPSVRAMIQARLAKLQPPARQLVLISAVLGTQASAKLLWQVAELGMQAGVEALEEAVASGILGVEEARAGCPASYYFTHELIREIVYTESGEARRQVLHQHILAMLETEGAPAAALAYHALACGETRAAARYSVQAADEALAVFAVEDAIRRYEQARSLLQEQQRMQSELPVSEVEHLYVCLGQAYAHQHAWQQAQQTYEELLAYAQRQQLPGLASMTLNRLAVLALQQSKDKPQVHTLLEEAWRMAEISHEQRVLAETAWNQAQIWDEPKRALLHGEQALALARGIHDQELKARGLSLLGWIHLRMGDFEEAMPCLEAALGLYATLGSEPTAAKELSLPCFTIGAPLTQPLTKRALEALCWGHMTLAQVQAGQVQDSLRSGRRALALSKEIKNAWTHIYSTLCLAHGLLEAGAYEEALMLMQDAIALARTLPPMKYFQRFLIVLGMTYQALQQWEEAQAALEEAEALAERLGLGVLRVSALSQLCMLHALAGEWKAAYHYAAKALAVRKSYDASLILLDFSCQYEIEALLYGGEESQARAAVHRLGERVGPHRRFRIVYLRSLAALAAWEGQRELAINHLHEAAGLAADLGLPAERWQIQAALGNLYEAGGEPAQARTTFEEAVTIIQGLAEGFRDEARRARFLAGPQIQQVMQQAQREASHSL